jgi:hypothetical protein
MTIVIADSFNPYNAIADATSYWDGVFSSWALAASSPFNNGQSLSAVVGTATLTKDSLANAQSYIGGFYYQFASPTPNTGNEGGGIQFRDGGTAQVTVTFKGDNSIVVRRGGVSGTIIATFNLSWIPNRWDHYQVKVKIDPTVGEVHIRKNNNASDDFVATGLNTRATANSQVNGVQVLTSANMGAANQFKDVIFVACDATAPNDWIGEKRAYQLLVTTDTAQKNFSPSPASSTAFGVTTQSGSNTLSVTANNARTTQILTAAVGGTLGKSTVNFSAGFTGKAKVGLYDSDGGSNKPGTLLATSNEVVNPVTGANDFTYASPPTVVEGHQYYELLLTDTNCTVLAGASGTCYTMAQTYTSGLPSNASTATSGSVNTPVLYGTITASNAGCLQEAKQDAGTTYVFSSTAGDIDLYNLGDMTVTPTDIACVQVRGFGLKTDAGTCSGRLKLKSGSTTVNGSTVNVTTSYANLPPIIQTTDPNTSAAWTLSGVNGIVIGQERVT